ncbi:unnamed protein product [Adineta steineri]|uniref:Uncharacterized protein n=1 Tax=Adineta steineri TaxID=433720 RepID=A0A814N149_9BILA|nr:unnamed protein product [Adineta steineri]
MSMWTLNGMIFIASILFIQLSITHAQGGACTALAVATCAPHTCVQTGTVFSCLCPDFSLAPSAASCPGTLVPTLAPPIIGAQCGLTTCPAGATCILTNQNPAQYVCICPNGVIANPYCPTTVPTNTCLYNNQCANGGTCVFNQLTQQAVCICPPNTYGANCATYCSPTCAYNWCYNGGQCTNVYGQAYCSCPQNYRGRRCELRYSPYNYVYLYQSPYYYEEVYLNLVLEFIPETVYRVARHYTKQKQTIPLLYVKLYMYQLFRALAYIHSFGICHRDIKPQNLLLDPETSILKLCDFGSAKQLIKGEPNVSYICSRYYRAPELIFGAIDYTCYIDVWSSGCVFAELLLGQPIFPGESGVDQLVEIIKVLGTPTREQIRQMNPNYQEFRFPQIKAHPWNKVFRNRTPPMAIDLVCRLLDYTPATRLTPLEACAHAFFDELRDPDTRLTNGSLPLLFNFSQQELNINPSLNSRLIPAHMQGQQTVIASGGTSSSSTVNTSTSNADNGSNSTTGTSLTTPTSNDKLVATTNRSNNSPPPSTVSTAVAAATNVNGPTEGDIMNSLDEQTAIGGDSINKDHS